MSSLAARAEHPRAFDGPSALADGAFAVCVTGPRPALCQVRPGEDAGLSRPLPATAAAGSTPWRAGGVLVADPVGHALVETGPAGGRVVWQDDTMSQPNDLTALEDGRVLCTDPDWATGSGRLWLVDPDGRHARPVASGMGTANGIAVDHERGLLYLTESTPPRLLVAGLAGVLGGAPDWQLVRDFTEGLPDGIALDGEGRVLVTVHGTGTLHVVDPASGAATPVPLRGPACTNVAVGGPAGEDVLVTFSGPPGLQWLRREDLAPQHGEAP